jgi:hypothetical protein
MDTLPHRDTPLNGLIDAIEQQLEQIKKEHDFHAAQEKIHAQLRAERESQALHLQETISLFKTRMQSSVYYSDVQAGPTDVSNFSAEENNTAVLHAEEKVTQNSFEPDDLESKNQEIDNILKEVLLAYPDRKISPDSSGNYGDSWSSMA